MLSRASILLGLTGCLDYGVKSGFPYSVGASDTGAGTPVDTGGDAVPTEPEDDVEPPDPGRFSYGWHILDEGERIRTDDAGYAVTHHGDADGFWYEPSGQNGLMSSSDPVGDFAAMRDYVLERVPEPGHPMGNLHYYADSTLERFDEATFTYVLADFMLTADDDVDQYRLSVGGVDDAIKVLLNGQSLGVVKLDEPGREWPLGPHLKAGDLNTLIVILMDNDERNKFIQDLAFYKGDLMMVGGGP